jgi:hypothetical protein
MMVLGELLLFIICVETVCCLLDLKEMRMKGLLVLKDPAVNNGL